MSVNIKAKMRGLREVRKAFLDLGPRGRKAMGAAQYQFGQHIMFRSKKLVPVEFSILRNSGYVSPPKGFAAEVEIGFGTDYAVPVHERLEVRHTVGQAKYLEKAVNDSLKNAERFMAALAKRHFERGTGFASVPSQQPKRPKVGKRPEPRTGGGGE